MSATDSIDFADVQFPSDRLSVKSLRSARGDRVFAIDGERLDTMLYLERLAVEVGYKTASGEPRSQIHLNHLTPRDIETELADHYQYFNIADGPATAGALVSSLNRAGASQIRHSLHK